MIVSMKKTTYFFFICLLVTLLAMAHPSRLAVAQSEGIPAQQLNNANMNPAAATSVPLQSVASSLVLEDTDLLTFTDLGFDEAVLLGPFATTGYFFDFPATWRMIEGAELRLVIDTFYTQNELTTQLLSNNAYGGSLLVQYNYITLTSIDLSQIGQRQIVIPIPLEVMLPLVSGQRHSLRFILESGINCDVDFKTTVILRSSSQLFLPHEEIDPPTDLTRLPFPIFQRTITETSAVMVVPAQPTAGELQAALSVAAGFGRMTSNRLPLTLVPVDQLTPDARAANHLIFVGKPGGFSMLGEVSLPAPISKNSFTTENMSPSDGIIQMALSPWNKSKVVLVVGGNEDQAVINSAKALSTGSLRVGANSSLALVSEVRPMLAGAEGNTVDRTLAELGYESKVVNQVGLNSLSYEFEIPQNYTLRADAYLELFFSHTAMLEYERSNIVVKLNGEPVGSVPLIEGTVSQGQARINLPASAIRPGTNRIDLEINLELRNVCLDPTLNGLWLRIDSASLLHLPLIPRPTSTSILLDLSRYPAPFAFDPLLSDLAFVLAHDDPVGWNIATQIAFTLGNASATQLANLAAFFGDNVPEEVRQTHNFIIVGRPSKLPIVSELSDFLPAPFETGTDLAIEKNLQVAYHLAPSVDVGYLELLAAPWNTKRAILLVGGSSDLGLQWSGTTLQLGRFRSQLAGNLAFINGEQIVKADTRIYQGVQDALATAVPDGVIPVEFAVQAPNVQRPPWIIPTLIAAIAGMIIVFIILAIQTWHRRRVGQ
jgi:cellulose synthase operon protein B